jgi:ATP-dependent RNA helicase RhlE
MPFSKLGLSDALVRAVAEQGYTEPTPIQQKAIPAVLAGGDLLAGAQTGTGKTAGFVLPMLQRLAEHPSPYPAGHRKALRALILTPTRELAAQVEESIRVYGKHLKISSMVLFGGVSIGPQTTLLKRGVDILVATPGRLLDHHGQGNIDFSRIEIFVLDEADRMLDMGFIPDVKRVLALLPRKRQNLLFSATFSDDIKALADRLLDNPQTIEVAPRNSTVDAIAQRVHPVDREKKRELLSWLIGHNRWKQVLVFTRTKHGADKLARALEADGIGAVALHGNKSQNARTRALAGFKDGAVEVLVATDIAARGIDIDQLPHVVNYDLPNVPEDYVHRIGRTGRAGNEGEAISLVCIDEHEFLRDIERLIKRTIPRDVVPGFEPDPKAVAQPVFAQRQGRGQGQGRGHGQQARPRQGNSQGTSQRTGRDGGQGNARAGGNAASGAGAKRNAPASRAHTGGAPASRTHAAPVQRTHVAPAQRPHSEAAGARAQPAATSRNHASPGQRTPGARSHAAPALLQRTPAKVR